MSGSDAVPNSTAHFSLVERMVPYSSSIFGVTGARAVELGAVNLGQGFPDTDGPELLKELACQAIQDGSGNQYPPAHGMPVLREAIAEHQKRFYGLTIGLETDVVVTTGASEALVAAFLGLLDTDDEVIIFEPFFDLYPAGIALAGGRHIAVPLRIADGEGWHDAHAAAEGSATRRGFRLDVEALERAVTPRTKMILINSPHNPTGMVFTQTELESIAAVAIKHDLVVLSDEAYEHLVFAPAKHIPIATLPGMFERTITVGSGGKCFSFTGWKVGWATGPANLINAIRVPRQHMSYVSGGPFQAAIAAGLRLPDSYFRELVTGFKAGHDQLATGLHEHGFEVFQTDGTYFITTDTGAGGENDATFCKRLLEENGVATIPNSALVDHRALFPNYVRWAFCKQPEVLQAALDRLS